MQDSYKSKKVQVVRKNVNGILSSYRHCTVVQLTLHSFHPHKLVYWSGSSEPHVTQLDPGKIYSKNLGYILTNVTTTKTKCCCCAPKRNSGYQSHVSQQNTEPACLPWVTRPTTTLASAVTSTHLGVRPEKGSWLLSDRVQPGVAC